MTERNRDFCELDNIADGLGGIGADSHSNECSNREFGGPALALSNTAFNSLADGFRRVFGSQPEAFFSAPGRTELGGNHTDHQRGRVLAAAVNLDTRAAVAPNNDGVIRVQSEGYPLYEIDVNVSAHAPITEEDKLQNDDESNGLNDSSASTKKSGTHMPEKCVVCSPLAPVPGEKNTTAALIRGVAARFIELGCNVGGFDAYVESSVLLGSGLSSSAAFEVLMGTVINEMFFESRLTPAEVAAAGQYAENVFYGKACGLMDQTASAVGGLVAIDFYDKDRPVIEKIDFDFTGCGYTLCIVDTRADHSDLSDEYSAIPAEMGQVSGFFGKAVLSEVNEADFYRAIPEIRKYFGERAVLRCIHFFEENKRVLKQAEALKNGDFATFLTLVRQSGRSSWMYLQNVIPFGRKDHQDMALALALCDRLIGEDGAFRVHGGGFSGTVQAFVPDDKVDEFRQEMDNVFGEGSCQKVNIRQTGSVKLTR